MLIRNIEAGIRGIKMGTKIPSNANVGVNLNKLKEINDGLYDDYFQKYKAVLDEYNKKQKK